MSFFRPEILEMSGYVPGEQPGAGRKVIKLNTNENPYPPPPGVESAVQEAVRSGLARYPDPLGTSFRLAAGEVLGIDPESILCGNGSDDLLTIVTRACVGAGQSLRLPYPSYVLYRTLAQLQGARWDEVAFREDWTLGADFSTPTPDLRLAFLPNPNSPTGTMLPPAAVAELASGLAPSCLLIVDEAYIDFAEESCLALASTAPNVAVTRTLSKGWSLAGLRFGYLVAPPATIHELRKVKDSYNCDSLSIAAATAAILDQRWQRENRERIVRTRGRLTAELERLGFQVIPSQANFVWAEHATAAARTLYERLKEQGVLVRYMRYDRWREGLRISVGTDEQIDALLLLLAGMV